MTTETIEDLKAEISALRAAYAQDRAHWKVVEEERDRLKAAVGNVRIGFAAELSGQLSAVIEERKEFLSAARNPPFSQREQEMADDFVTALTGLQRACYSAAVRREVEASHRGDPK